MTAESSPMRAVADWFTPRAPRERPDPPVRVRTRRAVPAWLLRAVAAVALAVVGLLMADGVATLVMAAGLAVVVALAPHGPVPAVAVAATIVHEVVRPEHAETLVGAPPMVSSAVVIAGLHLMVHLCRRAGDLGPRAAVELAALRLGVRPALAAQAVAQVCGVLAAVEVEGSAWPAVIVVVAGLVVVAATGRALQRRERAALAAERARSRVDEAWTWSTLQD